MQAKSFPKILQSNKTCDEIKQQLIEQGFDVEYVKSYDGRRFAAIRCGEVRLIDNVCLGSRIEDLEIRN